MYWLGIAALSAIHYFYCKGVEADLKKEAAARAGEGMEAREASAENRGAGKQEKELQTDPLDMESLLKGEPDPLARHYIYTRGIELAYARRAGNLEMRQKAAGFAQAYVDEFHSLKEAVFLDLGESRYLPVFKQLAIMLEETKDFDKALSLCKKATLLGLDDGTKTGYQGRINRIKKKMG